MLDNRHVSSLTPADSPQPAIVVPEFDLDELDFTLQEDHSNVVLDLEGNADDMLGNLAAIIESGPVGPLSSEVSA